MADTSAAWAQPAVRRRSLVLGGGSGAFAQEPAQSGELSLRFDGDPLGDDYDAASPMVTAGARSPVDSLAVALRGTSLASAASDLGLQPVVDPLQSLLLQSDGGATTHYRAAAGQLVSARLHALLRTFDSDSHSISQLLDAVSKGACASDADAGQASAAASPAPVLVEAATAARGGWRLEAPTAALLPSSAAGRSSSGAPGSGLQPQQPPPPLPQPQPPATLFNDGHGAGGLAAPPATAPPPAPAPPLSAAAAGLLALVQREAGERTAPPAAAAASQQQHSQQPPPLQLPPALEVDTGSAGEPGALARSLAAPTAPAALRELLPLLCAPPRRLLCRLVEASPEGAVLVLGALLATAGDGGSDGGGGGVEGSPVCALLEVPVGLASMEVVNRLVLGAAPLPRDFLRLYVSHAVASCYHRSPSPAGALARGSAGSSVGSSSAAEAAAAARSHRFAQLRLVRLVCVLLSSLIRQRAVAAGALFVVVQAFCVEFGAVKEAAALFRLLRAEEDAAEAAGGS